MSGDAEAIVEATVGGLGYECVDFERSARGLVRVFIDKADGISVEDCAIVSNQLSRVFLVEGIDFDRLEVSSPGLDRPLKRLADFQRFIGQSAKVKLHARIGDRKRFDGVIRSVGADGIAFALIEAAVVPSPGGTKSPKSASKLANGKHKASDKTAEVKLITVPLENIDRARLIPEI
jgi:ribosome maturation factor RimP